MTECLLSHEAKRRLHHHPFPFTGTGPCCPASVIQRAHFDSCSDFRGISKSKNCCLAGVGLETLILNSDMEYPELEEGDVNWPLRPVVSGRTAGPQQKQHPPRMGAHLALPRFRSLRVMKTLVANYKNKYKNLCSFYHDEYPGFT